MTNMIYCAIGDIHGELERLKELHQRVLFFVEQALSNLPVQFIHLGDLVDRGPESCGVVEYLRKFENLRHPKPITLRGNHEQMMLDAYFSGDRQSAKFTSWLGNGGGATEASYADAPASLLPDHIAWMKALPTLHQEEAAGLIFVHAGIDPAIFPACDEAVHMWTRRREFMDPACWTSQALRGRRVIHGHTPTRDSQPEIAGGGQRVNIDTGAVYGGQLTAMLIQPGEADIFLHT